MEELYLSSDALRSLSRLSRYLIIQYDVVIKMSDPMLLPKVFHTCKNIEDPELTEMFNSVKEEIVKPPTEDTTSFAFYVDEEVQMDLDVVMKSAFMPEAKSSKRLRIFR